MLRVEEVVPILDFWKEEKEIIALKVEQFLPIIELLQTFLAVLFFHFF